MTGRRSWVPGADDSGFGVDHLPYGVFSDARGGPRVGVRIGDFVCDLAGLARRGLLGQDVAPEVFAEGALNALLAAGPGAWQATRDRLGALLAEDGAERVPEAELVPLGDVELRLPFAIADYVDFYSSLEHATNLGRLFRPDGEPLLPNWRWLPVGYHGRAGTVVPSGSPVRRPVGQRRPPEPESAPGFGPSTRLDFELEVGFVTGPASPLGEPVPTDRAAEHIFGVVLVNDWSARDLQAWEYQPLGPFLGKSFATSISHWVTPLAALDSFRVPAPAQDPPPLDYLRVAGDWGFDVELEVGLRTPGMRDFEVVSRTNLRGLYWTMPQQLAHATVNGASVRPGDLYASGTVSGAERGTEGSLIELSRAGAEPLRLSDGTERSFLEDGDEVVLRGRAVGGGRPRLVLGEVTGRVLPARGTP